MRVTGGELVRGKKSSEKERTAKKTREMREKRNVRGEGKEI